MRACYGDKTLVHKVRSCMEGVVLVTDQRHVLTLCPVGFGKFGDVICRFVVELHSNFLQPSPTSITLYQPVTAPSSESTWRANLHCDASQRALPRPTSTTSAAKVQRLATSTTPRCYSDSSRTTPISTSNKRHRPTIQPFSQPAIRQTAPSAQSRRTIFIQTEDTPNADALKFKPNHNVLPENFPSSFLEYLSPRSTLAPPHPSPLAAQLMNVDGVTSVFYGKDYITVTKDSATPWAHVKPEVFSLITETVTAGQSIVNTVENKTGEDGQGSSSSEVEASYSPEDEEVVGMIQELLETRIRPAIQEDGGDIEFRGFPRRAGASEASRRLQDVRFKYCDAQEWH